MSRAFSTTKGSVESLKVRCRWGCRPKTCQTRCTVDFGIPVASSMGRQLHCVPDRDFVRSGVVITAASSSSARERGRPGRSSSGSLPTRSRRNRWRHVLTVAWVTPNVSAIAVLLRPSCGHRIMRTRAASPGGIDREAIKARNCARSSVVKTNNKQPQIAYPNPIRLTLSPHLRTLSLCHTSSFFCGSWEICPSVFCRERRHLRWLKDLFKPERLLI